MADSGSQVMDLLEQIGQGDQPGVELARRLESLILEQFPDADDDAKFEQLLHILASYSPGGGEFLCDGPALIEEARRVLSVLRESFPGGPA